MTKHQVIGVMIVFAFLISGNSNNGYSQLLKPLKGGERILWIGNSYSEFSGPVTDDISAIYKVANPDFIPIKFSRVSKGCAILKEFVVWGTVAGGTGALDSIREGNWDYVVFQTWEDAVSQGEVSTTFMGCGGAPGDYPANQDTLLKYLKVLDGEAKAVGAKDMVYAPHVATWTYLDEYQKSMECYAKDIPQVNNIFFAPVLTVWDSVKHDYPPTVYACPGTGDGIFALLYGDCGHQNATGMALDAFTWYTILSGGYSAVGFKSDICVPDGTP